MCSTVFILVPTDPGEHRFHDLRPHQCPTIYRESLVSVVLLTTALVIVVALLAAVGAGKLARLEGAAYATALTRAATAFAAVLTLSATVTAAFAALFA
jgi:hypothetical protein